MKLPGRLKTKLAALTALSSLVGCGGADGPPAASEGAEVPEFRERPASAQVELTDVEPFCPETINREWRDAQTVEGIEIAASPVCAPDNPWFVAAVVKGTNNSSMPGVMKTRLAMDAVVKENDRDGDGDPDDIHIRLEVVELNGSSPETDQPVPGYPIAPGVRPGFWAFAPKTRGMSTETSESLEANPLLRMPSPTIRVEQGDFVKITLQNGHYFPHTIHLHGVDHPYVRADGEGNDGVPQTSGPIVMPGKAFTYEINPRQPGTMGYHCHVQTGAHVLMGLFGMFVIEENRPNNWLQTINVGAGHVRHPSKAVLEEYDREYDLHYTNADDEFNDIIKQANDPRLIAKNMNRVYRLNERVPDYFLLNGRSYPYTLRESLVVVKPDENIKLRIINAGSGQVALHTHGHKPTITHYDGVEAPDGAKITRDVIDISTAQRVDLHLSTVNDGLHNYGEGVWLYHDHNEQGITTGGMMPGGDIAAIVYESYLGENGMPKAQGVDLAPYFTEAYWRREVPVWIASDPKGRLGEPAPESK
jgi:FtsP/CotA-like multicopper oxidase with cupredoxin domain